MTENRIHPGDLVEKAYKLVTKRGNHETRAADDPEPFLMHTSPEGVDGFHVIYGATEKGNRILRVFRGGAREGREIPGGERVFRAVFSPNGRSDPFVVTYHFDPESDWRRAFLAIEVS